MDLSQLSTDDLKALQAGDISKVSSAGLKSLQAQASAPAVAAPPAAAPSTAETIGSTLREIPRQVGLTARYGIEGAGRLLDVGTEPIRQLIVNPLLRVLQPTGVSDLVTGKGPVLAASTGNAASALADTLGLPSPQNADERVIGDAARMVASSAGMAGAARAGSAAVTGVTRNVLEQLAARPGVQLAAGAGAGAAGGAVREGGGGPLEQFGASLAGGVAGGVAADKASGATNAIRSLLTPKASQVQNADQQIQLVLQRSGIDWSQVPERIRQGMRDEVASALTTGQPLNADAVRRLLVFRQANVTPTVGMLTQDPVQITREMNLAKTGANSTDLGLQRLPGLQNQNTAALLQQLDEAGAANAPSAAAVSRRAIEDMQGTAASQTGNINRLYSAARDTSGRSLPLEGGTFTARANQLLDQANVGSFLPPDIAKKMNAIATGEYPLTVDVAEQLKTSIGNLQRGSADGNARRALGLVRQALDEAPLQGSPTVNPGNLPTVPGTVPPSAATSGQQSIDAFNAARSANRTWMRRVESNPALQAVVDGVEPDQFVQRYLVGKSASAADVQALRGELSPQAVEQTRQYLLKHLRDAATNNTDDVTVFSNSAYRRALRDIGDDKLSVFFDDAELQRLRDIGDAAKLMQSQPAGSAVNNSNSGALILGRGIDMLERISGRLPLGLKDTISGTLQGVQQSRALSPRNALIEAVGGRPAPGLRVNPLLAASVVTPAEARENDRRK